jgi:nitrogen-specific signal transduction histidine kinase
MNRLMQDDGPDRLKEIRHDIRNQLSNIQLAAEQLRYEIPDTASEDYTLYIICLTACS